MARVNITAPATTYVTMTPTKWLVKEGTTVRRDDTILMLTSTSYFGTTRAEAQLEMPAPASGDVHRFLEDGATVEMGQVLGWIETRS